MPRHAKSIWEVAHHEAAAALIRVTTTYLLSNNISLDEIIKSLRDKNRGRRSRVVDYRHLLLAYQEMGLLMSTWFTDPRFQDAEHQPIPLNRSGGGRSVQALIRASRASISCKLAVEFMRRSPSISVDSSKSFRAVKRVFSLPEFELPRAALVIERYLGTLHRNSRAHDTGATPILERSCWVPSVRARWIAPMLRDIKDRG